MSARNLKKKSWWKRRWIRIAILLIIFAVIVQLEQQPSSNPLGANVVVFNAIIGIWLWVEIVVGLIVGIIWVVKKLWKSIAKNKK